MIITLRNAVNYKSSDDVLQPVIDDWRMQLPTLLVTPQERLRWAREAAELTQPALARECGWESQSRISHYETGRRSLDPDDVPKMVAALRRHGVPITAGWLLFNELPEREQPALFTSDALPPGKYLFPRTYENVIAGLGRGRFNEDFHIEVDGTIPIPASLIASKGWKIHRLAVVNTKGLSMYPTLYDGQPVVINLDEVRVVPNPLTGVPQIYAIEDEEEGLRIKRLSRVNDGRILVTSDNKNPILYPDDWITPESTARVVGRVVFRMGEL